MRAGEWAAHGSARDHPRVGERRRLRRHARLHAGRAAVTRCSSWSAPSAFPPSRDAKWGVVIDMPVDDQVLEQIHQATGVEPGDISLRRQEGDVTRPIPGRARAATTRRPRCGALQTDSGSKWIVNWVVYLDFIDWLDRQPRVGQPRHPRQPARHLRAHLVGAEPHPRDEHRRADAVRARLHRRAVPGHRVRRLHHGAGAGALDHRIDSRALPRHRAGAAGRFRPSHSAAQPRSARRAGRVVQHDDVEHRGPAAAGGREAAPRGGAAHRPRDPDVAAAARRRWACPGWR